MERFYALIIFKNGTRMSRWTDWRIFDSADDFVRAMYDWYGEAIDRIEIEKF